MTDQPVAIVTGASQGIGAAIARQLHERGYRLALMSRSGCVEIAAELDALAIAGSLTEEADIARLAAAALERYGRIDAAVANAGRHAQVLKDHGVPLPPSATSTSIHYDPDLDLDLFAIPWQAWHDDLDLLVLGAVKLAKAVTATFVAQGKGAFVAITGMEGPQPRLVYPLGPIRLALHGFAKLYADRYGRHGLRFNCVMPGMMENAKAGFEGDIHRAVPLQRLGGLREVAATTAFLLSDEAGYITGQAILVDGGLNRGI